MACVDPELFAWSYDFVGDLAETVALIWPDADPSAGAAPGLAEIVAQLTGTRRSEVGGLLAPWLDAPPLKPWACGTSP
jgi:DNA ligase-1